jgi:rod shape determining protein RodA
MRRFLSFRDFDWLLLGMVLTLCALSVVEIHSATMHTRFASFESKQILWMAAGMAGMFILAKIDYHRLLDWSPWAYGVFVFSLLAVKVVGRRGRSSFSPRSG